MDNNNQQGRGPAFPLMLASPGETVRVSRVPTDKGSAERLASLGIQQGDIIKVVQNQAGSLIIEENAAGARYVLGGGMANRIFVTK